MSLKYQIMQRMNTMKRFGQSKHKAKQAERERCRREGITWNPARVEGIYSKNTYSAYHKESMQFAEWCQANGVTKLKNVSLENAVDYIHERIQSGKYSPHSLALTASALNKVFEKNFEGDNIRNHVQLPRRSRENITRSRLDRAHDREFSERNHRELIRFCKATGLRRHELSQLQGKDICARPDGTVTVHVVQGKGGRERFARVVDRERDFVASLRDRDRLFEHIPNRADIHSYRRDYAVEKYRDHERAGYGTGDTYRCRDGREFDRGILRELTQDLGHDRIEIAVSNYLD